MYILYIDVYFYISECFLVQKKWAANHRSAREHMGMMVSRNGHQSITAQCYV